MRSVPPTVRGRADGPDRGSDAPLLRSVCSVLWAELRGSTLSLQQLTSAEVRNDEPLRESS